LLGGLVQDELELVCTTVVDSISLCLLACLSDVCSSLPLAALQAMEHLRQLLTVAAHKEALRVLDVFQGLAK
jgi:hypothetical protein